MQISAQNLILPLLIQLSIDDGKGLSTPTSFIVLWNIPLENFQ
jgi:hypothetical protein